MGAQAQAGAAGDRSRGLGIALSRFNAEQLEERKMASPLELCLLRRRDRRIPVEILSSVRSLEFDFGREKQETDATD